jgi:hypothetical protein
MTYGFYPLGRSGQLPRDDKPSIYLYSVSPCTRDGFTITVQGKHALDISSYPYWNNVPHPAPGVLHIPLTSRDQMDVYMPNRLACGGADIDPHVEPIGW